MPSPAQALGSRPQPGNDSPTTVFEMDVPDLRLHLRRGQGIPEEGLPAGTRWDEVPPNWTCPECGARKEDFEMFEI
jgi:rubredoxin